MIIRTFLPCLMIAFNVKRRVTILSVVPISHNKIYRHSPPFTIGDRINQSKATDGAQNDGPIPVYTPR